MTCSMWFYLLFCNLLLIFHSVSGTSGPVSNVIVSRSLSLSPQTSAVTQSSISRRNASLLPPPLDKYASPTGEDIDFKTVTAPQAPLPRPTDSFYSSFHVMKNQIKELQVFLLLIDFIVLGFSFCRDFQYPSMFCSLCC